MQEFIHCRFVLRNVGWLSTTIRCYIPEDGTLHNHRCKNLESYTSECFLSSMISWQQKIQIMELLNCISRLRILVITCSFSLYFLVHWFCSPLPYKIKTFNINTYSGTSVYVRFGISPKLVYVLFGREKFCLVYDLCLEYDWRARTCMSQNESWLSFQTITYPPQHHISKHSTLLSKVKWG
jgi:hypothetical protein